MSIQIQQLTYIHTDQTLLFDQISFSLTKGQKTALVGDNGSGKTTLLQILAGNLLPSSGEIICTEKPYLVPQHVRQYDHLTIAQALLIEKPLQALHSILNGELTEENYLQMNDDWTLDDRMKEAFSEWNINHLSFNQPMHTLSGGEKTKVFLAGIAIHQPDFILMDEPSNHLDQIGRDRLYTLIRQTKSTLLLVSHDRTLLNLLDRILELVPNGVKSYGGNYDFYKEQKEQVFQQLQEQFDEKTKELRKTRKTARENAERKQRQDARGKQKQIDSGMPRIAMKALKNKAEISTAKLQEVHAGKQDGLENEVKQIRLKLFEQRTLYMEFGNAGLHIGKVLIEASNINAGYSMQSLWKEPLSFQICSGDRIRISGANGSGKTSLIKLITGELMPLAGSIKRSEFTYVYVDQMYSFINEKRTVYEQLVTFNSRHLEEHELKSLLHYFLFSQERWNQSCSTLSGGERVKLLFCCLLVANQTPDMFILDEPTNNLDIRSMDVITSVLKNYKGTIILVSHDDCFTEQLLITKSLNIL